MNKTWRFFLWVLFSPIFLKAQSSVELIREFVIRNDTASYSSNSETFFYNGQSHFFVHVAKEKPVCELNIFPQIIDSIKTVWLVPSPDFNVIDSLRLTENKSFTGRIRFGDLSPSSFPQITIGIRLTDGSTHYKEYKLFNYTIPFIENDKTISCFTGQECKTELVATHIDQLKIPIGWQQVDNVDYRFTIEGDHLFIIARSHASGVHDLSLNFQSIFTFPDNQNQLTNTIQRTIIHLISQPGKLSFLTCDTTVFYLNTQNNIHNIIVNFSKELVIGRNYRIEEDQAANDGLVAELTPNVVIGNNQKILCKLHLYALHDFSQGNLLVKDGSDSHFLINLEIAPLPEVDRVWIDREGQDRTDILTVFPSEDVVVRFEGKGLRLAEFVFESCFSKRDSLLTFDDVSVWHVHIPANIDLKNIGIRMNSHLIRFAFYLKENCRPHPLDFISLNYGYEPINCLSPEFDKPVTTKSPMRCMNLIFDPDKIDSAENLYGKQYLDVDIKIYSADNTLEEFQQVNDIVVCPGKNSPRNNFYDSKDCSSNIIDLNDYLLHKTYELDAWEKVEIILQHHTASYNEKGYRRKLTIIHQRYTTFSLQAGFPTGLVIKKFGTNEHTIGDLSGISVAFLGQMKFYDHNRINKARPYGLGFGILA